MNKIAFGLWWFSTAS